MSSTRKLLATGVLVNVACALAAAGIEPVGDPIYGDSWGQQFVFSCPSGTVDRLAVAMLSGGPFESPTFREFDVADWSVVVEYPELAGAGTDTNPVGKLSFELWFASEPEEPLSLLLGAWHPGEYHAFEGFRMTWDEAGDCVWSIIEDDPPPFPIPAPGAALLGVIGLGLVGWVKRRL